MKNYDQSIEYIYGLTKFGVKLGLKNVSCLLSLFDNPHLKTKVIHIAGTNGKGSTAAMLLSILKHAGFRIGLYTSPHLIHFQERMRINDDLITKHDVCSLLDRIIPKINIVAKTEGYQHPTFFEVITTMAYLYFFENNVDFAIMEAGLGGRLDATNVCKSIISVITHIDYDHTDRLGNTLSEIANEKGEIIKHNSLTINARQYPEAQKMIEHIARKRRTKLYSVGIEINSDIISSNIDGNTFHYSGICNKYQSLHIPLAGRYQIENASMAIGATELLNKMSFKISKQAIYTGLHESRWPGRFEIIQREPMIILDGAHNPNGVTRFVEDLKKYFPNKKIIAVLGAFSDKDYSNILKIIVPHADHIILTMANNPRATPTDVLARETLKYISREKIVETVSVDSAIHKALNMAKKNDIVCVTGSLYTVGEAKAYFLEKIKSK